MGSKINLGNLSKIELSVTVEPFWESKKSEIESAHASYTASGDAKASTAARASFRWLLYTEFDIY